MPFLVDSISLALTERALTLHFLTHPVFAVARDGAGNLLALHARGEASKGGKPPAEREITAGIVPACRSGPDRRSRGACNLSRRRSSAACATCASRARTGARCGTPAHQAAQDLSSLSARFDPSDPERSRRRCSRGWKIATSPFWATANIGCRGARGGRSCGRSTRQRARHTAPRPQTAGEHQPHAAERHPPPKPFPRHRARHQGELCSRPCIAPAISTTSASSISTAKGQLIGEKRFLGLWTSAAYNSNPREIPVLRHKVAQVVRTLCAGPRQP